MRVLIVGAGEVGWYLAQRLRAEGIDIVVVEVESTRADALSSELDVQVVNGSGSSPADLVAAGVERADLLAAVTQNDEVNLVASLLAKQHGVRSTIVRLQNAELRGDAGAHLRQVVGADVVIDPDADTADEIYELVHATGADEIYPMANGELTVIGAVIAEGSPFANRYLEEIGRTMGPNWDFLFGAVTRDNETVLPRGDQQLLPGDHVRVICKASARSELLELLGVAGTKAQRVMVIGGGAVGTRIAERLQDDGAEVVLIERDAQRAEDLARRLKQVVVIKGDATDTELLLEESVGQMDAVIAVTGEDGSNALACAFAISEGAAYTIVVLHSLALLPLVRRFGVDAALSPRTASANAVLRRVRGGATAVNTFLESDSEVDEIEIATGSKADGAVVADLHLPRNILIGALIRPDTSAEIVRGTSVLLAGDHIVVFGRPQAISTAKPIFTG
ncbi:MAG: Trk system potassium transporter TrkA [Actinomycetia bacterium]|nr:Trk system potassium transporter TrkA [Actinomycetes bacterium]MCP4223755.1 Trk system potassium transporter TrkA [Actinomycetes bacterium]MCP5034204.1 Trk system potassium transporter TrkA [Actinomycetes bacterium]